ncbi:hypothetical protein ABZ806_27885 [Spirillospora sp. NPDC047418]
MAQPDIRSGRNNNSKKITAVTRRDVFDYLRGLGGPWWGRLDEVAFLESLYDLDALPSNDSRYRAVRRDIIQHRVNNDDWGMTGPSRTPGSACGRTGRSAPGLPGPDGPSRGATRC